MEGCSPSTNGSLGGGKGDCAGNGPFSFSFFVCVCLFFCFVFFFVCLLGCLLCFSVVGFACSY